MRKPVVRTVTLKNMPELDPGAEEWRSEPADAHVAASGSAHHSRTPARHAIAQEAPSVAHADDAEQLPEPTSPRTPAPRPRPTIDVVIVQNGQSAAVLAKAVISAAKLEWFHGLLSIHVLFDGDSVYFDDTEQDLLDNRGCTSCCNNSAKPTPPAYVEMRLTQPLLSTAMNVTDEEKQPADTSNQPRLSKFQRFVKRLQKHLQRCKDDVSECGFVPERPNQLTLKFTEPQFSERVQDVTCVESFDVSDGLSGALNELLPGLAGQFMFVMKSTSAPHPRFLQATLPLFLPSRTLRVDFSNIQSDVAFVQARLSFKGEDGEDRLAARDADAAPGIGTKALFDMYQRGRDGCVPQVCVCVLSLLCQA